MGEAVSVRAIGDKIQEKMLQMASVGEEKVEVNLYGSRF